MSDPRSLLPVSIVVCTRNRAESLRRTLTALAGLNVARLPAVELVVVDNGSTDGTAEVVQAAAGSFPYPVRLVSCPEKGLSRARNAAVAAARHELIRFTDDDCLPESDWAVRLAEAFGGDPLQVIGGRVVDVAEGTTPGLTPVPADPKGRNGSISRNGPTCSWSEPTSPSAAPWLSGSARSTPASAPEHRCMRQRRQISSIAPSEPAFPCVTTPPPWSGMIIAAMRQPCAAWSTATMSARARWR